MMRLPWTQTARRVPQVSRTASAAPEFQFPLDVTQISFSCQHHRPNTTCCQHTRPDASPHQAFTGPNPLILKWYAPRPTQKQWNTLSTLENMNILCFLILYFKYPPPQPFLSSTLQSVPPPPPPLPPPDELEPPPKPPFADEEEEEEMLLRETCLMSMANKRVAAEVGAPLTHTHTHTTPPTRTRLEVGLCGQRMMMMMVSQTCYRKAPVPLRRQAAHFLRTFSPPPEET